MAMDRTIHDTPEKVLVFGLRKVGQIQQTMLSERDEEIKGLLREIMRLEVIEICRDKRITTLNNRLYNMGFKATDTPSPKKASDDELRVQVKRLTNQLRFHRDKSAGRKRYIDAMREAGMGKGPLVSKERPRGSRVCSKCSEYREHYKNCAYCIVCWKQYAPAKKAQHKYDDKRTAEKHAVAEQNGSTMLRRKTKRRSNVKLLSGSGLRLVEDIPCSNPTLTALSAPSTSQSANTSVSPPSITG